MISLIALAVLSPKLDTKITIRAEALTIQSVVRSISEQTGEKLETSIPIRDDRVVLYADQVPAKEVLDMLAKHFGWTWEPDGDALKLYRTPLEERAEVKAYRTEVMEAYKAWRSKSIQACKAADPASPRSDFTNAIDDAEKLSDRYYNEYFSTDPDVRQKWLKDASANGAAIGKLVRRLSPVWRFYDSIVAGLTDDDLVELEKSSKLVFSFYPTSWQRPLPSTVKDLVSEIIDRSSKVSHLDLAAANATIDGQRSMLLNPQGPFSESDVGTVRFTIKRETLFPDPGVFIPTARVTILDKRGQILLDSNPRDYAVQAPPQSQGRHESDRFDEKLEQTEDLKSADLPSKTRQGVLDGAVDDLAQFFRRGSSVVPQMAGAKLLVEIAKAAHVNLISDVYDTPGWVSPRTLPLGMARQALDLAAYGLNANWSLKGDWVQIRTKNWEYARGVTMPARELFDLRDRLIDTGGSFDTLADAYLKISDRECFSPLLSELIRKYAGWESYDADQRRLYLMRFWASATIETKRNLLAGQSVTFGSLSGAQQQYLAAFVYRQDDFDYDFKIGLTEKSDILEKQDLDWIKGAWPNISQRSNLREDFEPTQTLPGGIPAGTLVGVHSSQANAMVLSNATGWTRALTEQEAIDSGYYSPGNTEFLARLAVEDRMYFTLQFSPDKAFGFEFARVKPDDESAGKRFSEFPDSVKQRLDSAYKARHGG